MVTFDIPDKELLEGGNEVTIDDFPRFAPVVRHRDPPQLDDIKLATRRALEDISALNNLPDGATVAITAGSRGISDIVEVLATIVETLDSWGLDPYVVAAMGSHGGATPSGQSETLAALGITEQTVGCEIRTSMSVRQVGTDSEGGPVFVSVDALEADGILLVNRVKVHTDYVGQIESGLSKMAAVGLGKRHGAEALHNSALRRGFDTVVPDKASVVIDESPIAGGIALLENANKRLADIVGLEADDILQREPELLDRSKELFPALPVDQLDFLMIEEMGKEISGTGMDTNVIGRVRFHNQAELDHPEITRIYVRSLTEPSHGNALGVGLADYINHELAEEIDLEDTYVNIVTSGETARAAIPMMLPADETAFVLSCSTTGVTEPENIRAAIIESTMTPDKLLVSEPVVAELADHPDIEIGELRSLTFEDGELVTSVTM